MKKPWQGRFTEKTSEILESFTESVSFDRRLWKYDIEGSIAHAQMLARQGIITRAEAKKITGGLRQIARDIEAGSFTFREDLEDVHMNIEGALIQKTGEAGRKLHTARSRNDQVALDLRLYLRDECDTITLLIKKLQGIFLDLAVRHFGLHMPGYTHLQRAQPVLLSHHLLAYVEMLQRDRERFSDSLKRINRLPLGSCALAGTTLPIDRAYVARLLGFGETAQNSIDAVSDRDFAIEFLSNCSILMMHLSRCAEELVLWSTEEFRFIELPDAFTTGSSIMPQKKNPDAAELIRGKTGRIYGNLLNLLTVMKGIPLAYNRDMQEDKAPVFDTGDTIKSCLAVLIAMLPGVEFNREKMEETAGAAYSTATDLAEYLVKKGVSFRKAHELTGRIVLSAIRQNRRLEELSLSEFRKFSPVIHEDIYTCLSVADSVGNKKSLGGTSPAEVKRQIKRLKKLLQ
ncbi:MAG: argininosuccinate lyase [Nitrospirota bacterium]